MKYKPATTTEILESLSDVIWELQQKQEQGVIFTTSESDTLLVAAIKLALMKDSIADSMGPDSDISDTENDLSKWLDADAYKAASPFFHNK